MVRNFFLVFMICLSALALAETDDEGYNEYTIRPADIPHDAPKFTDFPSNIFTGINAAPKLTNDGTTRMFRSRLLEWSKEKSNFAGHYILASWGCGTDCTSIAIIDAQTGNIYHPAGATTNSAVNIHQKLLKDGDLWHGTGAIKFREDSKLLILIGMPEEEEKNRGVSYFIWDQNTLKRIRFVPKAWYPTNPKFIKHRAIHPVQ